MNDPDSVPIVGTIQVQEIQRLGVTATVDGQRQVFPNLEAVFGAAVRLLDAEGRQSPPLERKRP